MESMLRLFDSDVFKDSELVKKRDVQTKSEISMEIALFCFANTGTCVTISPIVLNAK